MSISENPVGNCGCIVGEQECVDKLQNKTCPSEGSCCVTGMKLGWINTIKLAGKLFVNGKAV